LYIPGTPGRRGWYVNLLAHPECTFHLKQRTCRPASQGNSHPREGQTTRYPDRHASATRRPARYGVMGRG
jgi:hypothetical protein